MNQAIQSFNAGEISPYLRHRTEVAHHAAAVEVMENFLPLPFGGVRKRPGTLHLATLSAATRLEPFHASDGTGFILAITTEAVAVLGRDGIEVTAFTAASVPDPAGALPADSDGDPVGDAPDPVPFLVADPFAIQVIQLNDVAFLTAPDLPPLRLSRLPDATWTLEQIPFSFPPLLDENADEDWTLDCHPEALPPGIDEWETGTTYLRGDLVTVTDDNGTPGNHDDDIVRTYSCVVKHVSKNNSKPGDSLLWPFVWAFVQATGDTQTDKSAPIGSNLPLVSSKPLFDAGHIGATFQLSKKRALADFQISYDASSANSTATHAGARSPWLIVQGHWSIITFGTWHGTWTIEKSEDRGLTWQDYRQYDADGERNLSDSGEETKRVLLRLKWKQTENGSTNPKAILSVEDAFIRGLVKITAVASSTHATATVLTPVEPAITSWWTEGAFSGFQGYPAALTVHQRRLIFGGTRRKADSLWLSKGDDLLNFQTGTVADDSIFLTLAATRQDPIRWLASQRSLFVGTSGGEWVFGSESNDTPISPAALFVREYTRYGSAALPALTFNDSVYYIERQGRRLREMAYDIERQSYAAADLTRLAEHITESGAVQAAHQDNREPVLWWVRTDGTLLGFVYNRAEELAAWTRHTTSGGNFRSIAILRNPTADDEVFTVVQRGGTYHLEAFASGQQALQEAGDMNACHHLDAGVFLDSGESTSNTVAGLHHLDGRTIAVFADGIATTATVSSGSITLPTPAHRIHAGLPIASTLRSLPLDTNTDTGSTVFRMKRAHEILLDVFQSRGGSLQYGYEPAATLDYSRASDPPDTAAPYTGLLARTLPGGFVRDLSYTLTHTDPHPFTLRAAVIRWQVHEP